MHRTGGGGGVHTGGMDAGTWGIVAVLVVGTAVVAYGWLSDRAATRRQQELLSRPPERTIPRFHPDAQRPRYLSELEAAVRPENLRATELSDAARTSLRKRVAGAPTFAAGWALDGFVTDSPSGWAVLDDPLILICADDLTTMREALPAVKHARATGRPLVIVAPSVSDEVAATLQANNVQGTLACILVTLPSPDQRRTLTSLTGAQLVPIEDLRADWLPLPHLGTCATWVSDRKSSWVLLEPQPSTSDADPKAKLN